MFAYIVYNSFCFDCSTHETNNLTKIYQDRKKNPNLNSTVYIPLRGEAKQLLVSDIIWLVVLGQFLSQIIDKKYALQEDLSLWFGTVYVLRQVYLNPKGKPYVLVFTFGLRGTEHKDNFWPIVLQQ